MENKEEVKEIKKEEVKQKKIKKENKEVLLLKEENELLKEKSLRITAEFMNFKNRTNLENEKLFKYEGEDLIKELLTVLDNFERAIKMDDKDLSDEVSKFLSGFKMIYANLMNILTQKEIKEIEADGLEFNPEFMDAVITEEDKEKPSNVVLEILQKGYIYKDKVIRPAMVKVNK